MDRKGIQAATWVEKEERICLDRGEVPVPSPKPQSEEHLVFAQRPSPSLADDLPAVLCC